MMSRLKWNILWNLILLFLILLGIAGIFTPWLRFEVGSSANGLGFGNVFADSPGVIGFSTWAGIPVIIILLSESVLLFVNVKKIAWLAYIPPAIILLLPLIFIVLFDESSVTRLVELKGFNANFVSGAKFDYGIYVTILSASLIIVGLSLKSQFCAVKDTIPLELESELVSVQESSETIIEDIMVEKVISPELWDLPVQEPLIDLISDSTNEILQKEEEPILQEDPPHTKEPDEFKHFRIIKIALTGVIVLLLVTLFTLLFTNFFGKKNDQEKVMAEKARLENLVSTINRDIAGKNYEAALLKIGKIVWTYLPSENIEYVKLFEKQRENLFKTVQDIRNLRFGENSESSSPIYYVSANVDRAYVYSSPSYSARTSRYLNEGQMAGVHKIEDNFLFISYSIGGNYTRGWVLKSEFRNSQDGESRPKEYDGPEVAVDTTYSYNTGYEAPVSLASAYTHKDKNWNLIFSYGGTVLFKTETSRTPYEGTWQISKETVTIAIPSFINTPWILKVKENGLYNNAGERIWYVSQR